MSRQGTLFEDSRGCSCGIHNVPDTNSVRPAADATSDVRDLVAIVSQLEESKFLQLYRRAFSSSVPEVLTTPLELGDVEVYLTDIDESYTGFSGSTFDQIIHLPKQLWDATSVEEVCEDSLYRAAARLRERPDLLYILDGTRTYDVERRHGGPQEYEPEHYVLVTNICADLFRHDSGCPARFSVAARRIFSHVLGLPKGRCPSFDVFTPEHMLASNVNCFRSEAAQFVIDLVNCPSSYYLLAREGRISVIATTEHGTYFSGSQVGTTTFPQPCAAVVTSTISSPCQITKQRLSEFELLLNSRGVKELDIQRFLRENPEFLFAVNEKYCQIRPHVCLYDGKGERLIPDFMARIQDSNIWDIIELKLPAHSLTAKYKGVERASAAAARGISELLRYRDLFSTLENRRRVIKRLGSAPYEPGLALVIGRGQPNTKYEWESVRREFPNIQIISYDYLFEHARESRAAVARVTKCLY